ncbi:hypothetical protein BKA56DRAFT_623833 [Ilyonectria sp. MPI-CAGE-AT-0026]|nr:hypothetical protein BKA56DRAFT_623833 [Ilyonectria sp. MPI-CAGE-AT-0026]
MDLSLSALFERLSGRTPGSTLSHLGLRTYNDVFNAANSNASPIPTASHATIQAGTSGHVPETQHTDPADTMNTQIQAAERWISRPPPRNTTPQNCLRDPGAHREHLVHRDEEMLGKESGGK